ncbi:CAAD domain-containing protein [Cyanobium gracile]|uniref:CAAD domain-containing protein n=1 Tax=Cyanobium gracile TaxID=59930 RepID=UPI002B1FB00A|nr:CAAD domain-containing protein [Cyanobium gracile]
MATFEVPPLEGSPDPAADGGGEFELLLQKIREWLGSGELQAQWQRFRGPLKGLAILIGVVLLLRIYASLISTLDSLPVVGGLLELVGLIAAVRFTLTKMVRKSDREQVFADWSRRWNDFRGRE